MAFIFLNIQTCSFSCSALLDIHGNLLVLQANVISLASAFLEQLSALLASILRGLQRGLPDLGDKAKSWEASLHDVLGVEELIIDLGAGQSSLPLTCLVCFWPQKRPIILTMGCSFCPLFRHSFS